LAVGALLLFAGVSRAASVTLAWDANSEPVGGYVVLVGSKSGKYTTQVDVGRATVYQIKGLTPGTRYYVAVSAYNSSGARSNASAELSFVTPMPSCEVRLTKGSAFFNSAGGSDGVDFTVNDGCQWTASTDRNWVSLSPTSGTGGGRLSFSARSNGTSAVRVAKVRVGDAEFWVVQGRAGNPAVVGDYDGDGATDLSVFRPSLGQWLVLKSAAGFGEPSQVELGQTGDRVAAADFDGDGRTDHAVYRPTEGLWIIRQSTDKQIVQVSWGTDGDIPVPGDYDGDGRADVAVFRPQTGVWLVLRSISNYTTSFEQSWGGAQDVPVPGDYDGDGLIDLAVFRPESGRWRVRHSSNLSTVRYDWGQAGDVAAPLDFDGDGRVDITVYRPSTGLWSILRSGSNYKKARQIALGGSNAHWPVPGDFNGDGRSDLAAFRPDGGRWLVRETNGSSWQTGLGVSGDVPALRAE